MFTLECMVPVLKYRIVNAGRYFNIICLEKEGTGGNNV